MEATKIMRVLAQLAKSEGLYVETTTDDELENPDWSDRLRGVNPVLGCSMVSQMNESAFVASSGIAVGASAGLWSAVGVFAYNAASSLWRSVAGNYALTAKVQLVPVHNLVLNLEDPHRERLANKIRKIMDEHSVLNINALADKIQEDSSLVRKIILKYLFEYLAEDMSLNVVVSAKEDSENS